MEVTLSPTSATAFHLSMAKSCQSDNFFESPKEQRYAPISQRYPLNLRTLDNLRQKNRQETTQYLRIDFSNLTE
jgi:hypothetical protein